MRNLTIQILTKNNGDTIKAALESILPLNAKIVAADFGSNDETRRTLEYYGVDITKLKNAPDDYSKIRNDLLKQSTTDWNFYIKPNEILAYGAKEIKEIVDKNKRGVYFSKIFRGDTVIKEVRLWHKDNLLEFTNPVYECLTSDKMLDSASVIYGKPEMYYELLPLIKKWKEKSPVSSEPYYYEACVLLSQAKYDEFLKIADLYFFRDKKIMPVTMLRYYCAMVHCRIKCNADMAARYIVPCVAAHPLMAEFWCIFGDIYYFLIKDYEKAIGFYDNAIFLGKRRRKDDPWPIEIKKYKEYPEEMKSACLRKIKGTVFWGAVNYPSHKGRGLGFV